MGLSHSPKIVTSGLILTLDAANVKSYPGSGVTWIDISGNAKNCTLTNGPAYTSNNSGAISFDGTNDSASLPTISSTSDGFSVEIWINASRWALPSCPCANSSGIFDWSTGFWNYSAIFSNLNGPGFQILNQSTAPTGATVSFGASSLNTWYHLVGTFGPSGAGNSLKAYRNSILNASGSLTGNSGSFTVTAAPSIAGYNRHCGNCYIEAQIAKISVYDRPLSQLEVLQNFSAHRGRFGI